MRRSLALLLAFQAAAAPAAQRAAPLDLRLPLCLPRVSAPPAALSSAALPAALPRSLAAAGASVEAGAAETARTLATELARVGLQGGEQARLSSDFFDGPGGKGSAGAGEVGWQPRLPSGVKSVSVDEVRRRADVDRLIPRGANSHLIAKLKESVHEMAPYRVFTYHDAFGGSFAAIDLSLNPGLIDHFPDQASHEIKLIKKIQLWNKDLQLIVLEDGLVTPDIVLGGTITELKSRLSIDPGGEVKITKLLEKANSQVGEHAARHGLGHGAVAIDLARLDEVPVARIQVQLDEWSRGASRTLPIALDKAYVFAGLDLKLFVLGKDGVFHLESAAEKGP